MSGVVEMCRVAELGEEALELAHQHSSPREFVAALVEREHFPDAVGFLAHALPVREAIFWAFLCARRAAGAEPPTPIRTALEAVERWIMQPTDPNRFAAHEAAEAADVGTPAGCAAFAVFLSGGSLTPIQRIDLGEGKYQDTSPVEPPRYSAAKAIAGSVILSAVVAEPETAPERFRAFIAQGAEVANRIKLWPAEG